jgi:hypothetical protein
MFEICLSCAAAEVLAGISLTELLAAVVAQLVVIVCEKAVEDCAKNFVLKQ